MEFVVDAKIRNAVRLLFDGFLIVENSEIAQKIFNENYFSDSENILNGIGKSS